MEKAALSILLACSAGMSTSLLEKKIRDYLTSVNKNYRVAAMSSSDAKQHLNEYQVILLGPQVRFMLEEFKELSGHKPVGVIPASVYGLMKAKETIELAEAVYQDHQKK